MTPRSREREIEKYLVPIPEYIDQLAWPIHRRVGLGTAQADDKGRMLKAEQSAGESCAGTLPVRRK
jgi:hypothetical protein